jgi:hypothetical protein
MGFKSDISPMKTHFHRENYQNRLFNRLRMFAANAKSGGSRKFPPVLVRFDQVTCFIENANHSIM